MFVARARMRHLRPTQLTPEVSPRCMRAAWRCTDEPTLLQRQGTCVTDRAPLESTSAPGSHLVGVVLVLGHVKVPVRRRRVRVASIEQTQPLPDVHEQRDQEQHRCRDHDDLKRGHLYLPVGTGGAPMNGSGVFGVRY